jgi:hypothetical protein
MSVSISSRFTDHVLSASRSYAARSDHPALEA